MSILHIIENQIEDDLINIGSGEEISIYDLSLKIKNILDFHGEIVFDTSMPDGNPRKLIDSTKINSYGWKHQTSLDEGLKKTYDWFLENIA